MWVIVAIALIGGRLTSQQKRAIDLFVNSYLTSKLYQYPPDILFSEETDEMVAKAVLLDPSSDELLCYAMDYFAYNDVLTPLSDYWKSVLAIAGRSFFDMHNLECQQNIVDAQIQVGNYQTAEEMLCFLVEGNPENKGQLLKQLVNLSFSRGQLRKAAKYLEKMGEVSDDFWQFINANKGKLYAINHNWDKAYKYFLASGIENCRFKCPASWMFYGGLTADNMGDTDRAIKYYARYIESNLSLSHSDYSILSRLVYLLTQRGRYNEAVEYLGLWLDYFPYDMMVRKERLSLLPLSDKDWEITREEIREYMSYYPEVSCDILNLLARSFIHTGQPDSAEYYGWLAKSSCKNQLYTYNTLLDIFCELNDIQKASRVIKDAEFYLGRTKQVAMLKPKLYYKCEDYRRAALVCDSLLEEYPNDEYLLFLKAESGLEAGEDLKSIKAYEELLKLKPDNATYLNNLGYLLADKDIRLQEAKTYIQKALEKEPDNYAFLDSYGWVLYKLGELEKAEIKFKQAMVLYDRDPTLYEHLGDVLWAQEKREEAKAVWQKALKLGGNKERLTKKLDR